MPRTRALYALVQYVPDDGRAEGANAGVVLYFPETKSIAVRTSPTLDRVKKFFSPSKTDLKHIEVSMRSFEHRLKNAQGEFATEQEFKTFVAARADAVRLTTPQLVMVQDAAKDLEELYAELVGSDGASDAARAAAALTLPSRLAEAFDRLEASGKLWKPGEIVVPETKRKLPVAAAYKNGVVNYVLPRSLAPRKYGKDELPKLGFHGRLIHNHKIDNEEGRLVVVSAQPGASVKMEAEYAKVLDDFDVRFVPYRENEAFAAEVEATAH